MDRFGPHPAYVFALISLTAAVGFANVAVMVPVVWLVTVALFLHFVAGMVASTAKPRASALERMVKRLETRQTSKEAATSVQDRLLVLERAAEEMAEDRAADSLAEEALGEDPAVDAVWRRREHELQQRVRALVGEVRLLTALSDEGPDGDGEVLAQLGNLEELAAARQEVRGTETRAALNRVAARRAALVS